MKPQKIKLLTYFGLVGLFLISCNLVAPQPQINTEALYTEAAQTVQAQLTQQALSTLAAQFTQIVPPTGVADSPTTTQQPEGNTPVPTATPTQQPSPTATKPLPTPAPPTPTSIPVLCDHAKFIKDVTIADGTAFSPGAEFTKIWRLQNVGSCTWNTDYALIFSSGDRMSAPRLVSMPENVQPGETVDLAVDFLAPAENGRYRGYWMLSDDDGEPFGIGENANKPFWVEIRVITPNENFAYDFAINMCTATWRSSAGSLPCPGNSNSEDGSVVLLDRPELEDGRRENESTLWTRPESTRDGWIQGVYPNYKVREGDHFLAEIGCLADNEDCDVVFSVDYQVSGGTVKNLGEWYETYDDSTTIIDIDLSDLEGKNIQLILSVTNYGKPSHADAFWLVPSIRPHRPTPTPVVYAPAIEAARQRVAADVGVSVSDVRVDSFSLVEWKDSCLGVHLPDQVCAEAIIPGYKINMSADGKGFEAHTNMDGSIVYWFEI